MREINTCVFHCTATSQNATVEAIKNYWRDVMKWKDPGYHVIVKPNGSHVWLHPIEKPSNGVAGHNKDAIHISYIGGIDAKGKGLDNRTEGQKKCMLDLAKMLRSKFPKIEFKGHRDFPNVKKECPSFDVKAWIKECGL